MLSIFSSKERTKSTKKKVAEVHVRLKQKELVLRVVQSGVLVLGPRPSYSFKLNKT
jgi:hypothetical protein